MKWISPEVWVGFMVGTGVWLVWVVLYDGGSLRWLQSWQTLAGALVASAAVGAAIFNTNRSLTHAERLETRRRTRKHAAIRAVLPIALADILNYARASARALDEIFSKHQGNALPVHAVRSQIIGALPTAALETLTEFIEYSDTLDVGVIEATVAWIQIHDARVRTLVEESQDASRVLPRAQLIHRIVDAGAIFAGASSAFEYARRRTNEIPKVLTWEYVENNLYTMGLLNNDYEIEIARRRTQSPGPFAALS